jgi:hypothetical protein
LPPPNTAACRRKGGTRPSFPPPPSPRPTPKGTARQGAAWMHTCTALRFRRQRCAAACGCATRPSAGGRRAAGRRRRLHSPPPACARCQCRRWRRTRVQALMQQLQLVAPGVARRQLHWPRRRQAWLWRGRRRWGAPLPTATARGRRSLRPRGHPPGCHPRCHPHHLHGMSRQSRHPGVRGCRRAPRTQHRVEAGLTWSQRAAQRTGNALQTGTEGGGGAVGCPQPTAHGHCANTSTPPRATWCNTGPAPRSQRGAGQAEATARAGLTSRT